MPHAWWNRQFAQWTAPLAKAVPPPPPQPPPPPPVLPVVPELEPEIIRSDKRRKLQDHTAKVIKEPWKMDSEFMKIQEDCFQEYESMIHSLNSKIQNRDNCIFEQKRNINSMQRQLFHKNGLVRKKSSELTILRGSNISLQMQLDAVTLRLATDASENEEKINYYKSLVLGLQKTAQNAEESSQYLRHIKKLLFEYENGEMLEDTLKSANRKCSICMTNDACIVCMPCMHLEFCHGCAIESHPNVENHITRRISVDSTCPRCKGKVDELLYIFT